MDVVCLPFNSLIGLKKEQGVLYLPEQKQYENHLGFVHASALMALAEAASGDAIVQYFSEFSGFIPLVRKMETKFRRPAKGCIRARVNLVNSYAEKQKQELLAKKRTLLEIPVELMDDEGTVCLNASVSWFISQASA